MFSVVGEPDPLKKRERNDRFDVNIGDKLKEMKPRDMKEIAEIRDFDCEIVVFASGMYLVVRLKRLSCRQKENENDIETCLISIELMISFLCHTMAEFLTGE